LQHGGDLGGLKVEGDTLIRRESSSETATLRARNSVEDP
jgi:hypothetical protein